MCGVRMGVGARVWCEGGGGGKGVVSGWEWGMRVWCEGGGGGKGVVWCEGGSGG